MTTCPCCETLIDILPLDTLIARRKFCGAEAIVLRAIWEGGGLPVSAAEIFDTLFADDPDGGPSQSAAYRYLRGIMAGLSKKLAGSGVSIKYMPRAGYSPIFGEAA